MPSVPVLPVLTHPSTIGASSSARERVEKYLDQAGAAGQNQNQAALFAALTVAMLDQAAAVRENNALLGQVLDRLDRGLPHLRT